MKRASARWLGAAVFAGLLPTACGGPGVSPAKSPATVPSAHDVRTAPDRPPVAVLAREGDPRPAIAMAVRTDGIDAARGAEVATALAALLEARLGARGVRDVWVAAGWDGFRLRALSIDETEAARTIEALRSAMSEPAGDAELDIVGRKLGALAHRPMVDRALYDTVRCTGELYALPGSSGQAPTTATLEAWRKGSFGLGRVALAAVGPSRFVEGVARAVARGGAWARATVAPAIVREGAGDTLEAYDATSELPSGSARATLAVRTARPEQAVAAAEVLGDARGPLASRLGALEAPARLHGVTATALPASGCLTVSLDLAARDLVGDASARIATAVALARQEILVELGEGKAGASLARSVANRAADPREAAERAAWWTVLATPATPETAAAVPRVTIAIGLASARDAVPLADAAPSKSAAIRAELDRATLAWHEPVVEARSRVEPEQEDLWLLLASPCGTLSEVDADAGLGAVAALAASSRAAETHRDVASEAWVTPAGVGILVHGPRAAGESPVLHARRIADTAARAFAADPLDPGAIARARASLLTQTSAGEEARPFAALAAALAPGHPSWVSPLGTTDAIARSSDAEVLLRAGAVRVGPLRVAVLANRDAAQSDAAVLAVDRWVARRPGEIRACPTPSALPPPRPGTYAVEVPGATSAEAWLAFPLPPGDDAARSAATLLAASLDGDGGLLSRALGTGLARAWSAKVIGAPRAPALVTRIVSAQAALDAAVAQARALFDRLRQGALTEADRTRAVAQLAAADLETRLDPRARLVALWLGDGAASPPASTPLSLDAVRSFAAATLRDDALVIVAARPPRPTLKSP